MSFALLDEVLKEIGDLGIETQSSFPGDTLNTYRVGGSISHVVKLSSYDDVKNLSKLLNDKYRNELGSVHTLAIGKGSNILLSDDGFDGLCFIFTDAMASIGEKFIDQDSQTLTANAGVALPVLARKCVSVSASGLEFYVGIPGSVGGAVVMNAGGHGKQTSEVLLNTQVMDLLTGEINTYDNHQCEFSYRHSVFNDKDLIISATYNYVRGDSKAIKENIDDIVSWRRENQPGGRNVGSVFQNPEGKSAGKIIESCGLKNYRIGGAFVSDKHANFIQAEQDSKAADVYELIRYVQDEVKEKTGIVLQTEVRFIGMKSNG